MKDSTTNAECVIVNMGREEVDTMPLLCISISITAQSYTSIQRPIRINTSAIIAFNLKNKREEQAFLDEQSMWETIGELYSIATSPKYGFLYLNKDSGQAYLNFERLLST